MKISLVELIPSLRVNLPQICLIPRFYERRTTNPDGDSAFNLLKGGAQMYQVLVEVRRLDGRKWRCRCEEEDGAGLVVNNVQSSLGDSRSNALYK